MIGSIDVGVCGEVGCMNQPHYIYTWPTNRIVVMCEEHGSKAIEIARALDIHLTIAVIVPINGGSFE